MCCTVSFPLLAAIAMSTFLLPGTFAQLPSDPGCLARPTCPTGEDEHCEPAQYLEEPCIPNFYWECAFNLPVPVGCGEGLLVNPAAIENPNDTSVALCDWPSNLRRLSPKLTRASCDCNSDCFVPPTCPAEVGEDCKGAVYLPFTCDCQFYWVCDTNLVAHLEACGSGLYFRPSGTYSGTCDRTFGRAEGTACVPDK